MAAEETGTGEDGRGVWGLQALVFALVVRPSGPALLGGWIHPPLYWRYAFVSASLLVVAAGAAALVMAGVCPGFFTVHASAA